MREIKVNRGQRYQKADGTGIVFEVIELVDRAHMPHARLSRLDNPSEERVIAIAALRDKRLFTPTSDGTLPMRERRDAADLALEPAPGD
ncbi:MAG: hypothetical protein AB7M05_05985 [Alphaproteobacteria bacterium]